MFSFSVFDDLSRPIFVVSAGTWEYMFSFSVFDDLSRPIFMVSAGTDTLVIILFYLYFTGIIDAKCTTAGHNCEVWG